MCFQGETVQARVYKSTRLWSFYADLEESHGTVESTKAVYDRILELKIATPQIIINYALFLEDNKYFEEAFKVYERGVELFKYPIAFEIWNTYISKFIKRYVRQLFRFCYRADRCARVGASWSARATCLSRRSRTARAISASRCCSCTPTSKSRMASLATP